MASEENRSVRVEFDDGGTSALAPEIAEGSAATTRNAIAIVVIGAVLIAGLLVVLRPADDQTADGNVRGTTTTTTTTPSTTTATSASPEGAPPAITKVTQLVPAGGLVEFEEIARNDDVFLALQFEEAENAPPRVLTSLDGFAWRPLATSLDHTSETEGSVLLRDYRSLIAIDGGFALLMRTIYLPLGSGEQPNFETVRLRSTEGAVWVTDDEFETQISTSLTEAFQHSQTVIAVATGTTDHDESLLELLRPQLTAIDPDSVCSATEEGQQMVVLTFCDGREPVTIGPSDISDPLRFDALLRCADERSTTPVAVLRPDLESLLYKDVPNRSVGTFVLESGGLGALYVPTLGTGAGCDEYYGSPVTRPPALFLWESPTARVEINVLPDGVVEDLDSLEPELVLGDFVLFTSDRRVWSLDIGSGEWRAEVEFEPEWESAINESTLFVLTSESVGRFFPEASEWEFAAIELATRERSIDFFDAEYAIVSGGDESFLISLPFEGDLG